MNSSLKECCNYIAARIGRSIRFAYDSRVKGIWLWDYRKKNRCSHSDAIKSLCTRLDIDIDIDIKDKNNIDKFGKYLRNAEECISQCDVIPLK